MSKRLTLSTEEIEIIVMGLVGILADGGDYVHSGKIGKKVVRRLKDRLTTEATPKESEEA